VLLPLPFYHPPSYQAGIVCLPLLQVFFVVSAELYLYVAGLGNTITGLPALAIAMPVWTALLWFISDRFIVWTGSWLATVRGSVMGLLVFTLLIIFSSVPVYRGLENSAGAITFLQVYQ
jgi:hypothetical protein